MPAYTSSRARFPFRAPGVLSAGEQHDETAFGSRLRLAGCSPPPLLPAGGFDHGSIDRPCLSGASITAGWAVTGPAIVGSCGGERPGHGE